MKTIKWLFYSHCLLHVIRPTFGHVFKLLSVLIMCGSNPLTCVQKFKQHWEKKQFSWRIERCVLNIKSYFIVNIFYHAWNNVAKRIVSEVSKYFMVCVSHDRAVLCKDVSFLSRRTLYHFCYINQQIYSNGLTIW